MNKLSVAAAIAKSAISTTTAITAAKETAATK
jgi:hypothetical protein